MDAFEEKVRKMESVVEDLRRRSAEKARLDHKLNPPATYTPKPDQESKAKNATKWVCIKFLLDIIARDIR